MLCGLIALAGSAVLGEVILQGAAMISPRVHQATVLEYVSAQTARATVPLAFPDPVLRYRGNPNFPTHDRLGFHNVEVPDAVDIVAVGDSQTYGPVGDPQYTWPAVLGRLTGKTVYNMGIGGRGSIEHLLTLDDALQREPEIVLLGLYFGNDLFEAYRAVYVNHLYEELKSPQAGLAIKDAESRADLSDEIHRLFIVSQSADSEPRSDRPIRGVRAMLSEHSRLYGGLRWIKDRCYAGFYPDRVKRKRMDSLWQSQLAWVKRHPGRGDAFERMPFRSVLTFALRNVVLDLSDPRIAEGLELTLRVLDRMAARCSDAGVTFAVVLIPTKETVFVSLTDEAIRDPRWKELVGNEAAVRERVTEFLEAHEIAYIDSVYALRACFDRGVQPYEITRDGHPNVEGYHAIAEAAETLLSRLEPPVPQVAMHP